MRDVTLEKTANPSFSRAYTQHIRAVYYRCNYTFDRCSGSSACTPRSSADFATLAKFNLPETQTNRLNYRNFYASGDMCRGRSNYNYRVNVRNNVRFWTKITRSYNIIMYHYGKLKSSDHENIIL